MDSEAIPIPYDQLLHHFRFESPQQAANLLVNAKRRFRRHLEDTVKQYVRPGELQEELEDLQRVVCLSGGRRLELADLNPGNTTENGSDFDLIDPSRLTEVFSGEPQSNSWLEADLGAILAHCLTMPVTDLVPDVPVERLPSPGIRLGELCTQTISLEVLRTIKEYARHCARVSGTIPPEVAAIIYNTCIALALEQYGVRITKSSDDVLRVSFRMIAACPWVPEELRNVAERSVARLR